jgi:hypothetical protein
MEATYRQGIKRLSAEMIMLAIKDFHPGKNKDDRMGRELSRDLAVKWFNDRDDTMFGYGFCLEYSELNPNSLRKLINGVLDDKDFIRKNTAGKRFQYTRSQDKEPTLEW